MLADIHHHLIYGVDDGPQTMEQTQAMLRRAHENGVTDIAATSHAAPGIQRFPLDVYLERLAAAQAWCDEQQLDICIHPGAEVFYTKDAPRMLTEGKIPTLNGTRTVLVEFSPGDPYTHIYQAVRSLGNAGYTVLIAHMERYACLRKTERIEELREDLGAYTQINAHTILSPGGFFAKRWLKKVLSNGWCDVIATDSHDVQYRPCRLRKCYDLLANDWGTEMAGQLCINMPKQLLEL